MKRSARLEQIRRDTPLEIAIRVDLAYKIVDMFFEEKIETAKMNKIASKYSKIMADAVMKLINDKKQPSEPEHEQFFLFYGGVFSDWNISPFTDNLGIRFNCVEQYMMYQKAVMFRDAETAEKIMNEPNPREQKKLGRQVKNFDQASWDAAARHIVYEGSRYKYQQNPKLKTQLMATKGTTLVECSEEDKVWGIGFLQNAPECHDRSKWKGKNWLGETLTRLRIDFENDELVFLSKMVK